MNFTVSTYDIDFAGHVNNQVYIRWLEDLRLAFLEKYYPLQTMTDDGIIPVLRRTDITYLKPILMFQSVVGTMWSGKASTVKAILLARFTVDGVVCAEAYQEGVFLSRDTGIPVRIPRVFTQLAPEEGTNV